MIFNHLTLFGVAVPLVFVWLILSLPVTISTNISLVVGFLCGVCVDILCDTPGVNALCCTILAFVRKPFFHLYVSYEEDLGGRSPSAAVMGREAFIKYLLTAIAAYCIMMFTAEAFRFFNFGLWALRVVCSTVYTLLLLYALDAIFIRRTD